MDNPKYVYQIKGLIELSNFAVEIVRAKCNTSSETEGEGEGEVKVKMYEKCINKHFN